MNEIENDDLLVRNIKLLKQNEIIPYIITKELKLRMITEIINSYTKKLELGFILYKNKITNVLSGGSTCIGERHSINNCLFKCNYKKDDIIVGLFHTHVDESLDASIIDLINIYTMGLGIIGNLTEELIIKIKCYERKNEYNELVDDEIDKNIGLYYGRKVDTLDELTNKYFNVTDILEIPISDYKYT